MIREPTRILNASAVALRDGQGRLRAMLAAELPDSGGPGLTLYDSDGQTRAVLGLSGPGAILALSDSDGQPVARLGVEADGERGEAALFLGETGGAQVQLTRSEHGPALGLTDDNGPPRVQIFVQGGRVLVGALDIDGGRHVADLADVLRIVGKLSEDGRDE